MQYLFDNAGETNRSFRQIDWSNRIPQMSDMFKPDDPDPRKGFGFWILRGIGEIPQSQTLLGWARAAHSEGAALFRKPETALLFERWEMDLLFERSRSDVARSFARTAESDAARLSPSIWCNW